MSGSQQLLLAAVQQAVATDPNFEYTTLLLPGNGTNGAQNNTFLDSSTNAFSITRNGNTTQGTFSPFSQTGWGNYFDGSGDELTLSTTTAAQVGADDFSIECFVFPTRQTNTFAQGLITYGIVGSTSGTSYIGLQMSPSGYLNLFFAQTASPDLADPTLLPINQWSHVVACRSGSTLSMFVNGSRVATTTTSATVGSSGDRITIGGQWFENAATRQLQGYISNARIVKGSSAYSASSTTLTVPTTPLTAITNTSLLTCQSNRFVDNSTNAFAITVNGNTSIQAFSPFNPTASWSAATYGGSGYFDGSGDYLNFTDSSNALDLGGAQASFECWIYPLTTQPSVAGMLMYKSGGSPNWNTTDGIEYLLNYYQSQFNFLYNNASAPATITSGGSYPPNQWYHIAVATNASNAVSLYINGTRVATATNAITKPTTRTTIRVGVDDTTNVNYFNGYIYGSRFIGGSGAYDASQTTITVPTAPITAVTNTKLLLSYTNAGIYDATSKNDLETVGNAQISTTQSKFGGSSMYFDGTGDYLAIPATQNIVFGTADFTIEMWVYSGSQSGTGVRMFGNGAGAAWGSGKYILTTTTAANPNKFTLGINNASPADVLVSTTTFNDSTWRHVAITRYNGVFRLFVNGILESTNTTNVSVDNGTAAQIRIGASGISGDADWAGYIDDLRITKGIARYTSSFTPPTTAFLTL